LVLVASGRLAAPPAQAQEQQQVRVRARAPLLIGRDQALPDQNEVMEDVLARSLEQRCDDLENRGARGQFESKLKSRVERLANRYALSEAQQKKLLLAGRGDIKRFFDAIDQVRSRVQRNGAEAHADLIAAMNELESLTERVQRDPFARGSFFAKTIASTLSGQQLAQYEKTERELVLNRHRSTIRWVLGTWDETLKLTAEQHRRLEALCEQQTRPPQRFGGDDYFGLLLQLSRLPEERLKPLFSDGQWKTVQVQIAVAKGQETQLKNDGYVPDDDVAGAPAGGAGAGGRGSEPQSKRG
jgi:hypothetical protein